MSAWVCSDSHITALAAYAVRESIQGCSSVEDVGKILMTENVRSVNHRYDEVTEPQFRVCKWAARHKFSAVEIIKAAHCLRYQSCEHPGWEASLACKILARIIDSAAYHVPGWDEAPWGIEKPEVHAITAGADDAGKE